MTRGLPPRMTWSSTSFSNASIPCSSIASQGILTTYSKFGVDSTSFATSRSGEIGSNAARGCCDEGIVSDNRSSGTRSSSRMQAYAGCKPLEGVLHDVETNTSNGCSFLSLSRLEVRACRDTKERSHDRCLLQAWHPELYILATQNRRQLRKPVMSCSPSEVECCSRQ